ncbi:MAG TPA: hypothetical protein VII06_04520 [Chloroflexota bacterium]|jgi:hypothetical protein
MRRLIIALLLVGSGLLSGAHSAWAIDYDEPVVPPQFLMAPAAPAAPAETAGLQLQVLRRESGDVAGAQASTDTSAATSSIAPVRNCVGWSGDNGGRAMWDWNTC